MKRAIMMSVVAGCIAFVATTAWGEPTYAEKLGWKPTDKVLIWHVDDAGMSHESNVGTIKAMAEGMATSTSIMMPCPWVSEYAHYVADKPDLDYGLHLTLTSEWDNHRWGPVAGKPVAPTLVDEEGCLWDNVELVVKNADPDQVEKEIRAQVDRALTMGLKPSHLDSHMGTLFADPRFAERYVKVGVELGIPVLVAGGHMTNILRENGDIAEAAKMLSEAAWAAGLPALDDIHTDGYGWTTYAEKKAGTLEFLRTMKPGITEFILHCTEPGDTFQFISSSGPTRKADLELMLDPEVKKVVEEQGIILTTWRELKARRDKVGK
ncbi:MAG: polysaccharide deacetylase family protein [Candidatus Hydrogenedentes bacterium]|nr:polysaccharide deacetylase family protein [Candidatus Hydrogenedentota bacterium]